MSAQPALPAAHDGEILQIASSPQTSCLLRETTRIDDASLCLSLDWNPSDSKEFCVTLSDGTVALSRENSLTRWKAHDLEVWCACFDPEGRLLLTGSDDSLMKMWDIRADFERPTATTKCHDSGVCCIQRRPHHSFIVASGSYDEKIRMWDLRSLSKPLESLDAGGGVWRIAWSSLGDSLAVAAMYGGARLLSADPLRVVKEYKEHASIVYGVAIGRDAASADGLTVLTCSFYDHLLAIWHG